MKIYSRALVLPLLLCLACGGDDSAAPRDEAGEDMSVSPDMPTSAEMGDSGHGGEDMPPEQPVSPRVGLFGPQVTQVILEIDYQTGAAPYTGRSGLSGDTWDMFKNNAARIFEEATPRQLVIPTALEDMEELTDLSAQAMTAQQLLELSRQRRAASSTTSQRRFHVMFLNMKFIDNQGTTRDDVLGVSIGDTGVIAMFKPVISSTSSPREVEQTTLIHEFGHAIGLTNNGIMLTSDHHDSEHGAHCDNRDCVMYYLNESAAGLDDFVGGLLGASAPIVFGPECLADIDAAARQ